MNPSLFSCQRFDFSTLNSCSWNFFAHLRKRVVSVLLWLVKREITLIWNLKSLLFFLIFFNRADLLLLKNCHFWPVRSYLYHLRNTKLKTSSWSVSNPTCQIRTFPSLFLFSFFFDLGLVFLWLYLVFLLFISIRKKKCSIIAGVVELID